MEQSVAIAVLCIAAGGIACQWIAWRFHMPAIVLLFLLGLVLGPGAQLLQPSRDAGPALRAIVGLAVAIVVFEGGLALNFRELRAAGEGIRRLTIIALPLSWGLGSFAAHRLGGMPWGPACLYGAITVVTGPTVVLPLLRHTRLQRRSAAFLKWEAIVNDPIGAILATVILELLLAKFEMRLAGMVAVRFVAGLVIALGLGVGAGYLVRSAFTRDQAPEVLKTPILIVTALGVYALSNLTMEGAGLLSATVFGITLTNLRVPGLGELRRFKEAIVVLLVSVLFVVLTADLDRRVLAQLSIPIILLTTSMLFVVRPLAIFMATSSSDLSWPERLLAGWIAPRGIVAAAVAGLAGMRLQAAGYPGAAAIMPAVFALIAATMILHGFTLGPISRRLRLTLSNTPGLAVIGASPWTTKMADALRRAGVSVTMIDIYPGALELAQSQDIPWLQAEILSDHGAEELEGRAIDYVIAATPDEIYNGLVCTRLAPEIGRQRVFQLAPAGGKVDLQRGLSREWRGRLFGAKPLDYDMFQQLDEEGWHFESVTFDGGASFANTPNIVPLLLVRANGALDFLTFEDEVPIPGEGDKLLIFQAPAKPIEGERTEERSYAFQTTHEAV